MLRMVLLVGRLLLLRRDLWRRRLLLLRLVLLDRPLLWRRLGLWRLQALLDQLLLWRRLGLLLPRGLWRRLDPLLRGLRAGLGLPEVLLGRGVRARCSPLSGSRRW